MYNVYDVLEEARQKYYLEGYSETERFGQFLCNHFVPPENLPWPELFHEKMFVKACQMFTKGRLN